MLIAIPTADGKLAMHFGHVREFSFITVEDDKITGKEIAIPPPHEPGILPQWLKSKNTDLVIAGGMGHRAQMLFDEYGIKVACGAPSDVPENIVTKYLKGSLALGANACDH